MRFIFLYTLLTDENVSYELLEGDTVEEALEEIKITLAEEPWFADIVDPRLYPISDTVAAPTRTELTEIFNKWQEEDQDRETEAHARTYWPQEDE